jgi:DNA polymerase-3 subunit delta'
MIASNIDCPWLSEHMASLSAARASNRVPHGLLIHESPGSGGEWLAFWTARLLLCTSSGPRPCGVCTACKNAGENRHADLLVVQLMEESKQIRIEQVRDLCSELALTSHQGGHKVGIFSPADSMNRFAANALLKTLEEPARNTLLILVASQPSRLPATIMSRCQRINIRPPSREETITWLQKAKGPGDWTAVLDVIGNAPFSAIDMDPATVSKLGVETRQTLSDTAAGRVDPVAVAERWSRSDLELRLMTFENWLTERMRGQLATRTDSVEIRPGAPLPQRESVLNIRTSYELLDRVRELKASLDSPINRSLALENVLRMLVAAQAPRAGVRG